jgi:organic radical activating enzyme
MQINLGAVQSLSMVDYPGEPCITIFLRGCNRRCSWCHNNGLQDGDTPVDINIVFDLLDEASGYISAVAVSGGEPLTEKNIEATQAIAAYAHSIGMKVGIHTSYRDRIPLVGPIDYAYVSNPDMHPKHVEAHRAIWYDHGGQEYTTKDKIVPIEKIGKFADH